MDRRQLLERLMALWLERLDETSGELKRYSRYDRAWANNFAALHAVEILSGALKNTEAETVNREPSAEALNYKP